MSFREASCSLLPAILPPAQTVFILALYNSILRGQRERAGSGALNWNVISAALCVSLRSLR